MAGTKNINPALCIHVGAHLICIDNKHMKDKDPRGNGTICRVIGIKLKEQPQSYRLVWAKKVSLAAICLDISSASFGIQIN